MDQTLFDCKCNTFFETFTQGRTAVLSSASQGHVTSRIMSVVLLNKKFYFQTDCKFHKYSQIKENPQVALCSDNMQIEGICSEVGFPSQFPEFLSLYNQCFPGAYQKYSHLESTRLFCISPIYIQIWCYIGNQPHILSLDFVRRIYEERLYPITNNYIFENAND